MRDLILLKGGDGQRIRIVDLASHKWKDIASLLVSDYSQAVSLEKVHRGDPHECLREVFAKYFLDRKPESYSNDWHGLLELFDDVGLRPLAEQVKNVVLNQ